MTTYDLVTEVTDDDSRAVFEVYDAIFGDQPDQSAWRSGIWDRHVARAGFRLARVYDEERLLGFGYGYTGERGQWWTDQAATEVFELLMGSDVAPRKEFLVQGAYDVDVEALDA